MSISYLNWILKKIFLLTSKYASTQLPYLFNFWSDTRIWREWFLLCFFLQIYSLLIILPVCCFNGTALFPYGVHNVLTRVEQLFYPTTTSTFSLLFCCLIPLLKKGLSSQKLIAMVCNLIWSQQYPYIAWQIGWLAGFFHFHVFF